MIRTATAALIALIPACQADETVAGYGAAGQTWQLTEMNGAPLSPAAPRSLHVTLTFPEAGLIVGQGPCNRYQASMTVPYPWFEAGPIRTDRTACPDLPTELAFFEALATMTQSEVFGDTLILRNDAEKELVFKAFD